MMDVILILIYFISAIFTLTMLVCEIKQHNGVPVSDFLTGIFAIILPVANTLVVMHFVVKYISDSGIMEKIIFSRKEK